MAVEHLRIALEKVPWDASMHNDLGIALAGQGRVDEAIGHYQAALEINPNDMVAHFNLGVGWPAAGRSTRPLPVYEGPGNLARLRGRPLQARVCWPAADRSDEAITHYQRALEIKPDLAVAHDNLGVILAGHGQIDEAIDHYRKAVEIKPDYEEAHNNLGFLLLRKGASTRPWPVSIRPWKSSPTSPWRTSTSASC